MSRPIANALVLFALAAVPVSAETLREALASTYRTNPTITAQRAALRATDANVAIARSAGRPQVSATAGSNQDLTRTGGGNGRNLSAGLDVSYPLFNGGSVTNNVRAAETRDEAGRYTLRAVEGNSFVDAVTAYMDAIRDRAIVALNQNNVDVLSTYLKATSYRFTAGELTRTDVAQSQARLDLSRSQLLTSQGRLVASDENYRRVVGHEPGPLAAPPRLPPLPTTPDEAVKIALVSNSDLIAIIRSGRAAGYDINIARAGRLPTVSAIGSGRFTNYLGTSAQQFGSPLAPNVATSTGVGVQARIPIYQGGFAAARIRQAQAIEGQLLEQAVGTERAVVAITRSAFATYQSALGAINANLSAVSANTFALEGARAESTVGTRTVLEVLNAEQELLNSQVQLVSAHHDTYVAGFQLLNVMGQAQADTLGLDGGPLYDPLGNYRHVSGGTNDWANDPNPTAVATRTLVAAEMLGASNADTRKRAGSGSAMLNLSRAVRLGDGMASANGEAMHQNAPAAIESRVNDQPKLGIVPAQQLNQPSSSHQLKAAAEPDKPRAIMANGPALSNGDGSGDRAPMAAPELAQGSGQQQAPVATTFARIDRSSASPARPAEMAEMAGHMKRMTVKLPPRINSAPVRPVELAQGLIGASGGWRVQLGAFVQRTAATNLFGKLVAGQLAGNRAYLVPAGALTRLQVGPYASRTAANAVCQKLATRGQACFALYARSFEP